MLSSNVQRATVAWKIKATRYDTRHSHKKPQDLRVSANLPPDQKASRGRVARLMQTNGIRSKVVKKYKATTNSNHNLPVADNLLNQNFETSKPCEKWLSDITYISTDEGWLKRKRFNIQVSVIN
ncbi:hypothetical protein A7975_13355 [Bacillus sp. FJAT-26390]|nr:hypothetical protein A7975_13355 [Bacillus sp. FJAT-26390]